MINPTKEAIEKWACENKVYGTFDELCEKTEVKMCIAEELWKIYREQKLCRWEFPMNIVIVKQPMTIENGLITPTMKMRRRECAKYFREAIIKCYEMGYMFPPDKK